MNASRRRRTSQRPAPRFACAGSPRRRRRPPSRGRRSRPRDPGRGRQCARSHGRHGGDHRAVYPHMNHIGGDGFWLVRERNGRVRALMGAGRAGANATHGFLSRARLRRHPGARTARRPHGAGRGRGLDAGAGGRQGPGRAPAARHAARGRDPPCRATAMWSPEPGPADRPRSSPSSRTCRASPRRFSPTARRPRPARCAGKRARRHARTSRQGGPRRISIAAMSAARSPPISPGSAAR